MDQNILRVLLIGGGIMMGMMVMGCTSQDILPQSDETPRTEAPKYAPSFTQFSDIPVPKGATMDMERSLLLGSSEEWTGRLVYSSSLNTAEVFDLYKEEMPKFGWAEMTVIRGKRNVMTYQRTSRVATIEIENRTLQGTEVSVTISPNASSLKADKSLPPLK